LSRHIEGVFVACRCATLALAFAFVAPLSARSEVFDIPAQTLATAIDAFCAATGAEVYYDGAAALGQRSSDVTGDHARDGALRMLLAGTNLVPLRVRDSAYLLINPGDDAARKLAAAKSAQDASHRRYFAVVQQGVLQSLCRLSDLTMMPEPVVIRLWIDTDGAVRRLEAADLGEHDRRILDAHTALRSLRLPEAPPPHMPQPVTVALLPGKSAMANYCPPPAVPIGH
jgi:hypothetical protein